MKGSTVRLLGEIRRPSPDSGSITVDRIPNVDFESITAIFDVLPNAYFFVKDRQGRFITVSAALARAWDTTKASIINKTDADFSYLDHLYRSSDLQVMKSQSPTQITEIAPSEDGLRLSVTFKAPFLNTKGESIGVVGVVHTLPYLQLPTLLSKVVAGVLEDYKTVSWAQIAAEQEMTTKTLNRSMRKHLQLTPTAFLARVRVASACNLLINTDRSIHSIAKEVGFKSNSHLSLSFGKIIDMSPKDYREKRKARENRK